MKPTLKRNPIWKWMLPLFFSICIHTRSNFAEGHSSSSLSDGATATTASFTNSKTDTIQTSTAKATAKATAKSAATAKATKKTPILILDVDNTFYSESELKTISTTSTSGIEQQIVQNTHSFCQEHLKMTPDECDELFRTYGSTPEGLRVKITNPTELKDLYAKFYNQIYENINLHSLLQYSHFRPLPWMSMSSNNSNTNYKDDNNKDDDNKDDDNKEEDFGNTGYTHSSYSHDYKSPSQEIYELLSKIQNKYPHSMIYLASNSPRAHVKRIIKAMGLHSFPFAGIVTPDDPYHHQQQQQHDNEDSTITAVYPTKASPKEFFKPILDKHDSSSHSYVFMDDSMYNLQTAKDANIGIDTTYHIHHEYDFISALKDFIQDLEAGEDETKDNNHDSYYYDESTNYVFSEELYLLNKNKVDANSINKEVWEKLGIELIHNVKAHPRNHPVTVVDLGAGLLSVLDFFMDGFPSSNESQQQQPQDSKDGILHLLQKEHKNPVIYYAFEPNKNLRSGCLEKLKTLGFKEKKAPKKIKNDGSKEPPHTFTFHHKKKNITVHLIMNDFRSSPTLDLSSSPDLVVGCCFADLFSNPRELMASIVQLTNAGMDHHNNDDDDVNTSSTLLYFPITFSGTTLLDPPQTFGVTTSSNNNNNNNNQKMIPSDTLALQFYSEILTNVHHHNLNPNLIVSAAKDFGAKLLSSGPSDWNIGATQHEYLWSTMNYFFKSVLEGRICDETWNMKEWFKRIQQKRPKIIAKNVDLLFRFESDRRRSTNNVEGDGDDSDSDSGVSSADANSEEHMEEIEFIAPHKVHSKTKPWEKDSKVLGPNEIEVYSICSLISSGTELKIFRGTFDNEEALDVNIKGMSDTAMTYPLTYGYSLVGKIVRCGSPQNQHLIGKHVFTFSPHSSHLVCDLDSVHIVPDGISPEDAMFLPSVETALSILHDAHVRLGERVAVFGQGLIGLLVTSILSIHSKYEMKSDQTGQLFGTVTAFDTISDRLAAASALGASEALLPQSALEAGPFDVSIEVSGNGRALQSAIDCTSDHGRVIIGSWYGNSHVPLQLGMNFHRSHKTLLATQVSEIPPSLRGLWSKERRFNLAWELLRQLRPSERLVTKWEELKNAQNAYDALDSGKEISVAFFYKPR